MPIMPVVTLTPIKNSQSSRNVSTNKTQNSNSKYDFRRNNGLQNTSSSQKQFESDKEIDESIHLRKRNFMDMLKNCKSVQEKKME